MIGKPIRFYEAVRCCYNDQFVNFNPLIPSVHKMVKHTLKSTSISCKSINVCLTAEFFSASNKLHHRHCPEILKKLLILKSCFEQYMVSSSQKELKSLKLLTHFMALVFFYTPIRKKWFSGVFRDIERNQWQECCSSFLIQT